MMSMLCYELPACACLEDANAWNAYLEHRKERLNMYDRDTSRSYRTREAVVHTCIRIYMCVRAR